MACKALKIIAVLIVAALIPISAMAGGRTLCDFFDVEEDLIYFNGNFQVFYDHRRDNPNGPILQYPQGGIKFELTLPVFYDEIERDAFLRKIKMVVLYNMTTGDRYILRSPDVYKYLDYFSGEYGLHLGYSGRVLGDWKVIVYGRGLYKAYFTISEDMLNQAAPTPVDADVSMLTNGDYRVKCLNRGANQYRLRVWDEGVAWQTNMYCDAIECTAYIPGEYAGERARIEARHYDQLWPTLFGGGDCNPYDMPTGYGWARSITWFDVTE